MLTITLQMDSVWSNPKLQVFLLWAHIMLAQERCAPLSAGNIPHAHHASPNLSWNSTFLGKPSLILIKFPCSGSFWIPLLEGFRSSNLHGVGVAVLPGSGLCTASTLHISGLYIYLEWFCSGAAWDCESPWRLYTFVHPTDGCPS